MCIYDCGCEYLSLVLMIIIFMLRVGENKYLVCIGYNFYFVYEMEFEIENNFIMFVDFIFFNELGLC